MYVCMYVCSYDDPVARITYTVLVETLNPAQSQSQSYDDHMLVHLVDIKDITVGLNG